MEKYKITVVVPIYNSEQWLKGCLNCILDQTFKQIEIYCIDDGSKDHSWEILQEYASKYRNITIHHQNNMGAGSARNRGISEGKGEYICFMDSDDYYTTPYSLELLYNAAKKYNALVAAGGIEYVEPETDIFKRSICFDKEGWQYFRDIQDPFYHPRFIFNRTFLRENQFYYPKYIRYEDPPFLAKVLFKAERFYAIKKVIYSCREGIDRISKMAPENMKDVLQGMLELLDFSGRNNLIQLHDRMARSFFSEILQYYYYMGVPSVLQLLPQMNVFIRQEFIETPNNEIYFNEVENNRLVHNALNLKQLLKDKWKQYSCILIYGAGQVGKEAAKTLDFCIPGIQYEFTVSDIARAKREHVHAIGEYIQEKEKVLILVAVGKKLLPGLQKRIDELGYPHVYVFASKQQWIWKLDSVYGRKIKKEFS